MKLKEFGGNGHSKRYGVDLPYLVGWLESLINDEEDTCKGLYGPKQRRLEKAYDALQLLTDVMETSGKQDE